MLALAGCAGAPAALSTPTAVSTAEAVPSTSTAPATTTTPSAVPTTTATPTATPTVSAPTGASLTPLTGGPVLAVKVDNTGSSRPRVGLNQADVVYVEPVEGGLTRLLAIYNTQLPTVEAVRSTRASDPELVAQYGPIAYIASGGAPNPLQVLDQSNLKTSINDRGGPGFARDGNRPVPYNLTSNLALAAQVLKAPRARSVGFNWSALAKLTGTPKAAAKYSVWPG